MPARVDTIHVVLTRACNLDCSYCYQGRKRGARLDPALLERRLRSLVPRFGLVEVQFSGGEPLVEWTMLERTVDRARSGAFGPVAYTWSLLSNGLLLDDERLRWLRRRRFRLQLSVQVDPRDAGVRERSREVLGQVRRQGGFRAGDMVTITVVPGAGAFLRGSVEAALDAGVRQIDLVPDLRPRPDALESAEEWMGILASIEREFRPTKGPHPVVALRPNRATAGDGTCAAARGGTLVIETDGTVWSCAALVDLADADLPQARLARVTRLGDPDDPRFGIRRRTLARRCRRSGGFSTRPVGRECERCVAYDSCRICPATRMRMHAEELSTPGAFYCDFERALERVRARSPGPR